MLAKTDLLQAQIDLNVSIENALNQENTIAMSKITLNKMLGRDAILDFEVADSLTINYVLNKDTLTQALYLSNSILLAKSKQIEIASLEVDESKKQYWPKVSLNAGYYWGQTTNSKGSIIENRYIGPQINARISMPIYTAGEINRKKNIAKINKQITEFEYESAKAEIEAELHNAIIQFENQKKLIEIEEENNNLARQNMEISIQRLKYGQTNSLEVHQAQESFVQSATRLTNFKYNMKLAESTIKKLTATR